VTDFVHNSWWSLLKCTQNFQEDCYHLNEYKITGCGTSAIGFRVLEKPGTSGQTWNWNCAACCEIDTYCARTSFSASSVDNSDAVTGVLLTESRWPCTSAVDLYSHTSTTRNTDNSHWPSWLADPPSVHWLWTEVWSLEQDQRERMQSPTVHNHSGTERWLGLWNLL